MNVKAPEAGSAPPNGVSAEYKYADVGVIPNDWKLGRLGDVTTHVGSGITPSGGEQVYVAEGRPFLRSQNVGWGVLNLDELVYISDELHASFAASEIEDGDVLLNITGASIGRSAVADFNVAQGNVNQHVCVIRPDPKALDPLYLNSYLLSAAGQKQIDSFQAGGNRQGLNYSQIRSFLIPLPTLNEQRAIADALTDLDRLLAASETLIAKKRAIKLASMQELLTGKTRLQGFSGRWTKINMTYDSLLKARIGWQGLTTAEYLHSGDYYLVTGTDLAGGRINWSGCFFVDHDRFIQDANIQLGAGDVLLTKDGTIGKVGFVDSLPLPATLNSGIFVIRPKKNAYIPLFLYYVLTSRIFESFLGRLQAGSTISHLYQKDFVDFTFEAPQLNEQRAITVFLSDMDAEIAALERRTDKIRNVKQGMVQHLLTGRVRLIEAEGTVDGKHRARNP